MSNLLRIDSTAIAGLLIGWLVIPWVLAVFND